ncbi:hypothetical protein JOC86_002038 [Bacillus pakistanensis]|uniref:DUF4825 domain-containing protein n=1 Tax=Rossellomorea pakistanensis TaxID=992288 RepID=A0ABS2NCA4_9BACI|nr:DUF4825 domain-containing protein [Bacillus pakistanensis]MBM7585496.1 hypothetical protein [Bacillus pakistanensis]
MKLVKVLLIALTTILFTYGCSKEDEVQMKSIEDIEFETLNEYIGTYVGGNRVSAIIGDLPGGESFRELDLTGEKIKVTYGFNGGDFSQNYISEYWFDGNDTLEKNFLYNAILLTILVPNSLEYHFKIDNSSFSVSRGNMVEILTENLNYFPMDKAVLKNEAMAMFHDENKKATEKLLKENMETFEELVLSAEFRNQFFEKFPIKD